MSTPPFIDKAASGMREILSAFSTSEARYFDEERYSEADIRKSLNDSLTDKKIDAMKRVLAAVSLGRDASNLFPDVVKNVSFQSLELKRLIYIYLVQYAENNRDLALLSINSFQKDLSDRSQLVRASALRAMASIKVLEVIQLVMVAVKTASNDSSPYVRKACAQCITKVYAVDPDQFFDLRTLLLKLMSDGEVIVVSSAVMTFHQICVLEPPQMPVESGGGGDGADTVSGKAEQGGEKNERDGGFPSPDSVVEMQLALLHPLFRRLCQDVLLMDSWAQQCCVDLLVRYCRLFFACQDQPTQEARAGGDQAEAPAVQPLVMSEDFRTALRTLQLLLTSSSQGVILAAVKGLCYLAPAAELHTVVRPLLRSIRQAPAESAEALMAAVMPLVEARPELLRPSIRDFLVQSFEYPRMKALKLKIVVQLVDETNVQLVLKELQTYVTWQSQPKFVQLSVQAISNVALKVPSVADACLRGLVKMLDSKCEALSCEAVVSLRALLQQRHKSSSSGLGSVLPHLARYLDDLAAPSARASVVWIIGHYQNEVPRLGPDVVRKLAKSFAAERQEVKQQILGLSLKVWAYHAMNTRGEVADPALDAGADAGRRQPRVTPAESTALLPRLEAIVDHIGVVASLDSGWDVRDMARAIAKLKTAAKQALEEGTDGVPVTPLGQLGLKYCKSCVDGEQLIEAAPSGEKPSNDGDGGGSLHSTWLLGSLAQSLEFPLDTYRPLPNWATENTSDEIRKVKVEATPVSVPKSMGSDNIGNSQHMEVRVQNPSNIANMPVVSSLEDLDLFYSDDAPAPKAPAMRSGSAPASGVPAPQPSLEQIGLGVGAAPVGTAVFGEDDESDEEEDSDGGDDWKYCSQAPAAKAPEPSGFKPPPRVEASVEAAADSPGAPAAAEKPEDEAEAAPEAADEAAQ
mmetsp:Transcript_46139/g.128346  ORF Transcript_46139/g.128346 Transcript_46139/m.128346 type:complete len:916 (-) Transcript_46139:90-2837(-)